MNRRQLIGLVLLLLCTQGAAADWSFEFKLGRLESAEEQWGDFYDNDRMPAYAVGLAYGMTRQIEIGLEVGYLTDDGKGFAPGHGILAGNVGYRLYPMHLQLTLRGQFYPDQWLVPYVGAGASRLRYEIETERQPEITGATDGYQYRAGLQLLLDNFDASSAAYMEDFGIESTYFFIEVQRIEASLNGTELGGTAYLAGFQFLF